LKDSIDIRTDVPKYRIYVNGVLTQECFDIKSEWREDLVTFIIGCSFSFESALLLAGLRLRHLEEGKVVPMFTTDIDCEPAGVFRGKMVVSMRPFSGSDAIRAVEITSGFPQVHGAPVHLGDPRIIGVADTDRPCFGEPVSLLPGELPVFWACGVTPQAVAMSSKPSLCITHAPGHMLLLDTPLAHTGYTHHTT
jgi:uncharacterized protein YcsI (UPF0317 family)